MKPARKRLKLSPSKSQYSPSNSSTSMRTLFSCEAVSPLPLQASDSTAAGATAEDQAEEEGYLLVEEDTTDSSLVITMEETHNEVRQPKKKTLRKKKSSMSEDDTHEKDRTSETEEEEERTVVEVEIDKQLDQSLETKSKQHNLTAVNVKNIIHEVITNEHVVAMMKAAINETEAVPPFEPKMTRSKLKEVVEKGVVIPTWNISPIKKSCDVNKAPQFVDIPLDDEDSSDEEYCPDEEEEDETAEDTFQESDIESTASSPRGSRLNRAEDDSCSPWQNSRIKVRRSKKGSMGPPPPPKAPAPKVATDSAFLEKLHAVEEELADCLEPYQPLSESEEETGVMAYRTRSKRPLRNIPLGQLEAELQAPDITPDMYDSSSAPEDKDWTDWLRGLMSSEMENEDECDDEDDPEYNFLADIDEPDVEDYRDDKAVRITKKEVNELMEELFETLKEDLAAQEVEEEGHEEEEELHEQRQTIQMQKPVQQQIETANEDLEGESFAEQRTVKQQLAFIRKMRQVHANYNPYLPCPEPHTLKLSVLQKRRLQQQLQQHVQLLTQIHLLSSPVGKLHSEAETTKQFLFELDMLAQRVELIKFLDQPGFSSAFRASNLHGALELIEELQQAPISYEPQQHPPDAKGHMRCFPVMPAELAWLFATRPVFIYPELLPCASLDPAMYCPRRTAAFTAAEDCLLVLGLRNMGESCDPPKLVSQFLLRKTVVQVRRRILQCCRPGSPDNIVKAFRYQQVLWPMLVACRFATPGEKRPPVERDENLMPLWLRRSLPVIYLSIHQLNSQCGSASEAAPLHRKSRTRQSQVVVLRSPPTVTYSFPPGGKYPPRLPSDLDFKRIGFVLLQHPVFPPSPQSSPLSENSTNQPQSPQRVLTGELPLTRTATSPSVTTSFSSASAETIEKIQSHIQTLVGLRRKRLSSVHLSARTDRLKEGNALWGIVDAPAASPTGNPSSLQTSSKEVIRPYLKEAKSKMENLGKESDGFPVSSHLACGEELCNPDQESDSEHEVIVTLSKSGKEHNDADQEDEGTSSDESRSFVTDTQEKLSSEKTEDDNDPRDSEDVVFARDYLHRVCEAVRGSSGLAEQLQKVLEDFSAVGAPDVLYQQMSPILQPWPQLLKDFAAFLTRSQASRCGLLLEHQLFEQSRRFLRRLGRALGETSSLYQEVVCLLQGCSAPSSEDIEKVVSLLSQYPDLQGEVQMFFQRLHTCSSPSATHLDIKNNFSGSETKDDSVSESDRNEDLQEEHLAVCAKNITTTSSGEKVVVWTREADRTILTACQQRGASQRTFRQVSAQLGNKSVQQVRLRFQDLMKLFYSAYQKSTSWSSKDQLVNKPIAAPD